MRVTPGWRERRLSMAETQDGLASLERAQALANEGQWAALAVLAEAALPTLATPNELLSLGNLLATAGLATLARQYFERILPLAPKNIGPLINLASLLNDIGEHRRARELCTAIAREVPRNVEVRRSVLTVNEYDLGFGDVERLQAAQAWGAWALARMGGACARPTPRSLAGRRLRIGYVSADLCQHTVGLFIKDVLASHAPERVEVFTYGAGKQDDWVTAAIRTASRFRDVSQLDDLALADLIRQDAIDVLVDLSGHTAGSRLLAFARRPAPVMVSWLGYFATTGLDCLDAVLLDEWHAPPGTEAQFVEPIMRLPRGRFCYVPVPWMPTVAPAPTFARGHVTFGCFNNTAKLNGDVLYLWAAILRHVPASRLVLKWNTFNDAAYRRAVLGVFARHGIGAERIELRGHTPHAEMLKEYGDIDIALDPFPFTGGMTSCEALWLGVPVVTWPQSRVVSRQTFAFLSALGLPELAARDAEDYVRIAAELAGDRARLAALRTSLRPRMQASPLCDVAGFTRSLEDCLSGLFRKIAAASDTGSAAAATEPTQREALRACLARAEASRTAGRLEDAVAEYRAALALRPDHAALHANLGALLQDLGRFAEAEVCHRRAIELDPRAVAPHSNLGVSLQRLGRHAEAVACFRQALALEPARAEIHSNLANALKDLGQLAEAEAAYRKAIELRPELGDLHSNLGVVLQDLGRAAEAEASFRRALALNPDDVDACSNLLFNMNYLAPAPPSACLTAARDYGRLAARLRTRRHAAWSCAHAPERLRVGFVSGDLRNHPVGYFLAGLLENLDSARVESIAYSNTSLSDELTARLQSGCAQWRSIHGLPDAAAAALIHADAPHVLVDLSGHTAGGRLPVFAYKPAPVQAAWLGYLATTGLAEMDYLLGDAYATPPADDAHFVERVWRLPETYLCYAPPQQDVAVAALPASAHGYVTFGCFNNLSKLNDAVVALWAGILQALPQARLSLKCRQLADSGLRAATLARFAAHGIAAERLALAGLSGYADYLAAYGGIDIALDPFPYPGGTTSVESLWMGVPVLTLRGDRFLARNGADIVRAAGLPGWIAADEDDYRAKALRFAADPAVLAVLRRDLRAQLAASPLCDTRRFARDFETALWGMWRDWEGRH